MYEMQMASGKSNDSIISIHHLHVERQDFTLELNELSVRKGSYVVLIGTNGAGKTTVIEALLDLTPSKNRSFKLAGAPDNRLDFNQIGAQLQSLSWNPEFLVGDIVSLHKALYDGQRRSVFDLLGIGDLITKRIDQLSRGERVRIDLFMAFAHEPALVFLDEPTSGLDAGRFHTLFQLAAEARRRGATVISATHDPKEVQESDLVWWIVKGRLHAAGSLEELISRHLGSWRGEIEVSTPELARDVLTELAKYDLKVVEKLDTAITFYGHDRIQEVVRELSERMPLDGWGISRTDAADLLRYAAADRHSEYVEVKGMTIEP